MGAWRDQPLRVGSHDLTLFVRQRCISSVTAAAFTVMFNKVKPLNADGTKPASPLFKRTRISVAGGSNKPVVEDNVA